MTECLDPWLALRWLEGLEPAASGRHSPGIGGLRRVG